MSTYDRVTTVVGDLEHPLYDDEHRRDVWNEAGAIAYQGMSLCLLVGLAVLAWVGGPAAGPAMVVVAAALALPSVHAMVHAQRRGVDPWRIPGTGPRRIVLIVGLALVAMAGLIVNSVAVLPDLTTVLGHATGAVVGGLVGAVLTLLALWGITRLARRSAPKGED